eukprot:6184757-Pleurochrysis_carterae.AAC.2
MLGLETDLQRIVRAAGVRQRDCEAEERSLEIANEAAAAEYKRREYVPADRKKLRDQDMRTASNKFHTCQKTQLKLALDELAEARRKLQASNAALAETDKRALGLAKKLFTYERQTKNRENKGGGAERCSRTDGEAEGRARTAGECEPAVRAAAARA